MSNEAVRRLCHDFAQPLMAARCSLELALALAADDPGRPALLADAMAALDRMVAQLRQARDAADCS